MEVAGAVVEVQKAWVCHFVDVIFWGSINRYREISATVGQELLPSLHYRGGIIYEAK